MKYENLQRHIQAAQHIAILQADNPDGDSLGSSLALEAILSEMGKRVTLLCAVDMPVHLRYLSGWDRVQKEIPRDIDIAIVVDASTESLFEYFESNGSLAWIKSKPLIVIDHHTETPGLSYANESIVEEAVATSEIIYRIAQELSWPLPSDACEMMAVSIMSDSLGLTTEASTPESYRVMADLIERGASIPKLEQARRELMRKEPELLAYKGRLLERVQFDPSGRIASVVIPWDEIERYSPLYNPSMLVLDDMRLVVGVDIAIAYKVYKDGKVTAKIRANYEQGIAGKLAAHFGGGGHPYAAGFKILKARPVEDLIADVNSQAVLLLDEIKRGTK